MAKRHFILYSDEGVRISWFCFCPLFRVFLCLPTLVTTIPKTLPNGIISPTFHLTPSISWQMDSDEVESSFKLNVTAEFQGKSIQTVFDVTTSMEDIIRKIQLDHKIPPKEQTYHVIRSRLLPMQIPKLHDAKLAATPDAAQCTLILTEGDSGKAFVMDGLSALGQSERDKYGVFPVGGKILNASKTKKEILNNKFIKDLMIILGLELDKKYTNTNSLRYGRVLLMTDQDWDGTHIKGLFIYLLWTVWPELLKCHGFLSMFNTPIVKVTPQPQPQRPSGSKRSTSSSTNTDEGEYFYSLQNYENWLKETQQVGDEATHCDVKYYKGLGTSSKQETRKYFSAIEKHTTTFVWKDDDDGIAIDVAFAKSNKKSNAEVKRRKWIKDSSVPPGTTPASVQIDKVLRYRDFINRNYILYANANLRRTIPSLNDGLKQAQRKVLFCSFKKNLIHEMKLSQFCGFVAENASYRHGEMSLMKTVVKMSQRFVGSFNINFLEPLGQFGTRSMGGKDHASARYISTKLNYITRHIFHELDDPILLHLTEDGKQVEPKWYWTVIPIILVNGATGVGVGWSCDVPSYNPLDIIHNIRVLIKRDVENRPELELREMTPWWRGFQGKVGVEGPGKYFAEGIVEKINDRDFVIKELPIKTWTENYVKFLKGITLGSNKKGKKALLESFHQNVFGSKVGFFLRFIEAPDPNKLIGILRLRVNISTKNMNLFNCGTVDSIEKFESAAVILEEFFESRKLIYRERRMNMLAELKASTKKLVRNIKLAKFVRAEKSPIWGMNREELKEKKWWGNEAVDIDNEVKDLLLLPVGALFNDALQEMETKLIAKKKESDILTKKTEYELWEDDLKVVEADWKRLLKEDEEEGKEEEEEEEDENYKTKKVLMFSATFNDTVKNLITKIVGKEHNEIFVKKEDLSLAAVKQYKVCVPDELSKIEVINNYILEIGKKVGQTMIFVRTINSAKMLHKALFDTGYQVSSIIDVLEYDERDKIIKQFKDGFTRVLISSDVLARGFDNQQVNLVINYDLPLKFTAEYTHGHEPELDWELYLFRVGRAGRFGRKGAVFNLICDEWDEKLMSKIENDFGSHVTEVPKRSVEDCKVALKEAGLLI